MNRYRKKPVVIEAVQWDGQNSGDIAAWAQPGVPDGEMPDRWFLKCDRHGRLSGMVIYTLEGLHEASLGDWIIKGVKGEFYPCRDDIFRMTYEEVTDAA